MNRVPSSPPPSRKSTLRRAVALGLLLLAPLTPGFAAAPPRKVVIFWAPYGGGHRSAALALQAEILQNDPEVQIVLKDILDFLPPGRREQNLKFYAEKVARHPELFNLAFEMNMRIGAVLEPYHLFSAYQFDLKAIAAYLRSESPDLILSSFNQATEALTKLRHDRVLNPRIPIGWQHTDFVDGKRFANLSRRIDMTFLPHEGLKTSWIELYGVLAEKVLATGIAVNPKMAIPLTAAERTTFLKAKGLNPEIRTIVLMSGVNAVGDFPAILRSIAAANPGPIQVVAICGKNPDQLAAVKRTILPKNLVLRAEGFVEPEEVGNYFKSAEAIVTKAGGLSSAEIFTIGKPVVFLDINGGQERYNIRYFEKRHLAFGVGKSEAVGPALQLALKDFTEASGIAARQRAFVSEHDPLTVGQWALREITALRREFPGGAPTTMPKLPSRILHCLTTLEEPFDAAL